MMMKSLSRSVYVAMSCTNNAPAPWLRSSTKICPHMTVKRAGSDVDAITEYVVGLHDARAIVHPDADQYALRFRAQSVEAGKFALHFDGCYHGLFAVVENGHDGVANGLYQAPGMFRQG